MTQLPPKEDPNDSPTIPAHVVRATLRWARDWGEDGTSAMTAAGITAAQVEALGGRCTPQQISEFIRATWDLTSDELFGKGGAPVPRGTFALLAHVVLPAANLREGALRAAQFGRAMPGIPGIEVADEGAALRLSLDFSGMDDPEHLLAELCLAIVHRFGAWLTGSTIRLAEVTLPYAASASPEVYRLLYGAPVRFDAPAATLLIRPSEVHLPIVRTEPDLRAYLRDGPLPIFVQRDYGNSSADRVRSLLSQRPVQAWPSAVETASELAISASYLRRQLADEGTSLRAIRDEILRDRAVNAILRGDPSAMVAKRLGFSDVRAFRRAFKRWTGSSPSGYRRG